MEEGPKRLTKSELVLVVRSLLSLNTPESTRDADIEKVYLHYQGQIGWHLSRLVGQEAMEDLYNDTFASVITDLPTLMNVPQRLPTLEQFQAWLYKIATNKAIDYLRRVKKITFVSTPSNEPNTVEEYKLHERLSYSGQEEQICERMCIEQALNLMSEKYRICLVLQDLLGLSQREIATKLGCSEKNVSVNVSRARQQFSKIFMELQSTHRKEESLS